MKPFDIIKRIPSATFVIATIALYIIAARPCGAGVEQAGVGPKAVQSFGLDRPEARPELEPAKINMKNPLSGITIPVDSLLSVKGGRVQLYSVSRLSESDMRNPFEIRVQVAVEMLETVFEIGGIIEGKTPAENTAILLLEPPQTRDPVIEDEKDAAQNPGKGEPQKKEQGKKISRVFSIGDMVQGFRIHDINRDGIIVEQNGKYVPVPRNSPVTVCVPLTLK